MTVSGQDEVPRDEAQGDVARGGVAQDEVARFAALLRELKERTDRSYGSLARRLAMNTSTLHRYCAGEAVPVDFAPVERFAALCGATPEERLDLHRRWLAALEARRRPRGGGSGERQGTEAETKPGSGPDRRVANPPEVAADEPSPAAPVGQILDGGVVRGPLTPAEQSAPGTGPGRRWYRRKRVLVAVAGAVLAVVGSLSALPDDGRRSTSENVRADGEPTPGGAATETQHGKPPTSSSSTSGSPSAHPSSGRNGTDSAQGKPSSPGPKDGTAPNEPRADTAGGPPLAWTANSHVWKDGCGHDYVIGKPPARVPPPPAAQDARAWAAAQGAVHGRETLVEVSVQGKSEAAVVLTALRVRVAGRAEPVTGNAYAMDNGCGGALTPRFFDVDLDKDRPLARPVAGSDAGTPIPAVRLPYRVSAKDPEVLLVTARTTSCDCRWYLELDWSSQGRTGTVRIDDHGRPFRTSAIEGLPRHEYDTSARGWRRSPA